MSGLPEPVKTMEVKIRPYASQNNQERPDQKGVARVHMSRDLLLDLRLDPGQSCYLWKADQDSSKRREAVAWLTSEKSLSKKVVQISKSFQEACGFKLGDDLHISAGGSLKPAENVILKEISPQEADKVSELTPEDLIHWEWYLREPLGRLFFFSLFVLRVE